MQIFAKSFRLLKTAFYRMKMRADLQALIFCVLFVSTLGNAVTTTESSQCGRANAVKAETYLETAAALIDRLRENLPEVAGSGDCKCPPKPMDCDEVFQCGNNRSGVYEIWPRNRIMNGGINVYCDMDTNGGGWTVIQRREGSRRPADFFFKTWQKYKTGFGDVRHDFWLGNDNIYAITNQKKYYLRIELTDFENETRYAFYDQFWLDNESQGYKLHVYDFSGDAGDSLARPHDGYMFSTVDRDNDNSTENCAEKHKGAWWYANCLSSNLNGHYNGAKVKSSDGIIWSSWKGNFESIKMTEIKVRPVDFKTDLLDMDVEPA